MTRREFISLVGGGAALWPLAGRAQRAALPVIGFLGAGFSADFAPRMAVFRQVLKEFGYVEGQNVAIEFRWTDGQNDRLRELAADLVRRQVAVIYTGGNDATFAAKVATSATPIVFSTASDPVAIGFVTSLNRPGGNVTGATFLDAETVPKRLELLHELVPAASVVGLLVNPTNPTIAETNTRDLQAAAGTLGLQFHVLNASTERDFDSVFATLGELRAGGLVIGTDRFFNQHLEQLATLTLRHVMPAICGQRVFTAAGGLMSYGADNTDTWRQTAIYTARILEGEKPADLPVLQPTKFELLINLNTAKAVGIEVSPNMLALAGEVIE